MNAKSGVKHGLEEEVNYGSLFETGVKALAALRDKDRAHLVPEFAKALGAFKDCQDFQVQLLRPRTIVDFLDATAPTQAVFNQLVSETDFWVLLDQIEQECFLQPDQLVVGKASFFADLWKGEVAANPFKPPKNWQYSPVEEAVAAYRKIFGSSLRAEATLKLASQAKAEKNTEGIAVWLKLSTLVKLFGVAGNPLLTTDEGRAAYARIVELFVPEVGKAFTAAGFGGFNNWRQGNLSGKHIVLTPAGIATWQWSEQTTDDDFCFSPAGASTGVAYAGHSPRLSRVRIVLAGSQMPQDCVMTGGTLAVQPERMSKYEHLGMDCPANVYSPGAVGRFFECVCWRFVVG